MRAGSDLQSGDRCRGLLDRPDHRCELGLVDRGRDPTAGDRQRQRAEDGDGTRTGHPDDAHALRGGRDRLLVRAALDATQTERTDVTGAGALVLVDRRGPRREHTLQTVVGVRPPRTQPVEQFVVVLDRPEAE
ncbi:hypothetical protein GCM10025883_05270 [Mobilicoccus caccae]|uniref:Uncharacterized protein n=1 Tax=Mobilicoccus caccae TaxID=1859295 RepID=A0ABQ6IP24_9MICO|nr:hypothetical protein GCM10025883_05270 [Mobilicoccus caccae]